MNQDHIRNFCIIAHVDHGKSTLADRILDTTNAIAKRDMQAQKLDTMDLERERGITIKMTAIRLEYHAKDGQIYEFNLIDTPGHVDFTYEVSRSLAACEGALLVVDAAQGVEAQTLANVNLAYQNNLTLIPVINKIDLPAAEPERVREEIENVLALDASDAVLASAKAGIGIEEILEQVVQEYPAALRRPESAPARAHFRQQVRPVSGRGLLCARGGRRDPHRSENPVHGDGQRVRGDRGRYVRPGAPHRQRDQDRRSRLYRGQHQDDWRCHGRRYGHGRAAPRHRDAGRLSGGQADGVLRPVSH